MARREREILEHAVRTVAEQAVKADELVDEAKAAGGGNHPVMVHAKTLRLELLKVKADLERELEDFVLNCSKWPRRSLGLGARDNARPLGAPRAGAAWGTGRVALLNVSSRRERRKRTLVSWPKRHSDPR
jgi:hypothetical protein